MVEHNNIETKREQEGQPQSLDEASGPPTLETESMPETYRTFVTEEDLPERIKEGLNEERTVLELQLTKETDALLAQIMSLSGVETVSLCHADVSNDGLIHLKTLPIETLDLSGTKITDAGLENLKALRNLKTLNLGGTQITDAGLKHIGEIAGLEILGLSDTHITNDGLPKLKNLTELRRLNLSFTPAANAERKHRRAGLEHLRGLKKLEELNMECYRYPSGKFSTFDISWLTEFDAPWASKVIDQVKEDEEFHDLQEVAEFERRYPPHLLWI